jgi:hypothetical protein
VGWVGWVGWGWDDGMVLKGVGGDGNWVWII